MRQCKSRDVQSHMHRRAITRRDRGPNGCIDILAAILGVRARKELAVHAGGRGGASVDAGGPGNPAGVLKDDSVASYAQHHDHVPFPWQLQT
jgi:hypothetical protein